jgi:hypothetical protein
MDTKPFGRSAGRVNAPENAQCSLPAALRYNSGQGRVYCWQR